MILKVTRLRERLSFACRTTGMVSLMMMSVLGPRMAQAQPVKVVMNDRGGLLGQRAEEIRVLAQTGQRVELRGQCLSACTLYLKLPNACVAPDAVFGFHGPSWYGHPLPVDRFEAFSNLMARHYREPLRSWFMNTARYRTSSYYQLSGHQLIGMGYSPC
ncbi:hypothetical protein [Thioclava sp.]|uniref:hypothetical protein n=1 Tax=Thioclava sp. TaxID=1933450 RepID=UPI003AA84258